MSARELLVECRNYMLNKAGRHDLNWRDAHEIVDRIDAHLSEPMPEYPCLQQCGLCGVAACVLQTDYDALRAWAERERS